jgi:hypothetical protein
VWNFVRNTEVAERQNMAMEYVYVACIEHIAAHHDWPHSWDDLEKTRPTVKGVTLPRDRQWLEQQMFIDFHANLKDIAQQKSANFTGFGLRAKPIYEYRYDGVIEEAQKAIAESATKTQSNK